MTLLQLLIMSSVYCMHNRKHNVLFKTFTISLKLFSRFYTILFNNELSFECFIRLTGILFFFILIFQSWNMIENQKRYSIPIGFTSNTVKKKLHLFLPRWFRIYMNTRSELVNQSFNFIFKSAQLNIKT